MCPKKYSDLLLFAEFYFFTDREFLTSERERAATSTENVLDELFFISLIKTRLNKSRVCSHQFFFLLSSARISLHDQPALNSQLLSESCRCAWDHDTTTQFTTSSLALANIEREEKKSKEKHPTMTENDSESFFRRSTSAHLLRFISTFEVLSKPENREKRELFLLLSFIIRQSALFSSPLRHFVAPAGTNRWKVFNAATDVCHHRT